MLHITNKSSHEKKMKVPCMVLGVLLMFSVLSTETWEIENLVEVHEPDISLEEGKKIRFESPKFPMDEEPGKKFIWKIKSPDNTKILLSCPYAIERNLCTSFMSVYYSGDKASQRTYCFRKSFTEISSQNTMEVEYSVANASKFECYLTVMSYDNEINVGACSCGGRNTPENTARILGGEATVKHEYPMMVAVRTSDKDPDVPEIFCGGTIISESYVLTAAHCVWLGDSKTSKVIYENYDLDKPDEAKTAEVADVIPHPSYKNEDYNIRKAHDIALLKLTSPMPLSKINAPVCLPFADKHRTFTTEEVTILGWGHSSENQRPSPPVLQKVEQVVFDANNCKRFGQYNHVDDEKEFCTHQNVTSLCAGDAGGPVLWYDPALDHLKLIGVNTYVGNVDCKVVDTASVNVRVTAFLDWIVENTPGTRYCKL